MGVWIETDTQFRQSFCQLCHTLRGCVDWNLTVQREQVADIKSHPSWVCGLKRKWYVGTTQTDVTPFVGVWIETTPILIERSRYLVTPFVGVWIETSLDISESRSKGCHTLRGCVDWNVPDFEKEGFKLCHTLRGCVDWNLPTWTTSRTQAASHPSWVCGLKHAEQVEQIVTKVTPFVGVWIETPAGCAPFAYPGRVTPFVGVWNETENRFYFLSPLEKVIFTKTCHWLSISYNDKKYDSGLL